MPLDLAATELFRDSYFPICHPRLLSGRPVDRAVDLLGYPLIHFDWFRHDPDAPTWHRWLATARSVDPRIGAQTKPWALSFREELHAIDAVLAGQGIAICSDAIVGDELKAGTLIRAHNLSLPGYGFYLVRLREHARRSAIEAFSGWIRSAI
jgi:LysR family glycine cleavage system transcriptional activator